MYMLLCHPFDRSFLVSVRTTFPLSLRTVDFRELGRKGGERAVNNALQHAPSLASTTMMSVEARRGPR